MTGIQHGSYDSYANVSQAMVLVSNVYHVEPVFQWTPISLFNFTRVPFTLTSARGSIGPANASLTLLGISDTLRQKYGVAITAGSWNLTDGIILPQTTARVLGVNVGDELNLTLYYTLPPNGTIQAATTQPATIKSLSLPWRVAGLVTLSNTAQSIVEPDIGSSTSSMQFSAAFLASKSQELLLSYASILAAFNLFAEKVGAPSLPPLDIVYRIFVRRDKITNLFDPAAMLRTIQSLAGELGSRVARYHIQFRDNLAASVAQYQSWLSTNSVSFYLFSLPVLAVSWYVTMTIWFLMSSRRRRTLGLFKVRGMSSKEIFRGTMVEAAVIGVVASGFGIATGYITGSIVARMLGGSLSYGLNLQSVSPETASIGVAIGVLISLLGAIRPAQLAASLQAVDAEKPYLPTEAETTMVPRSKWSWIALLLAIYKMMEWLLGFSPSTLFPFGSPSNNFFVSILFSSWVFLSVILTFLTPFLFIFSMATILLRGRRTLYRSAYYLTRSFLKELTGVAALTISRNPARVTRVAFLIALTFSFGVFTAVTTATSSQLQSSLVNLSVGADLNVQAFTPILNSTFARNNSLGNTLNESFASTISSITGVQGVTPIIEGYATSDLYYGSKTVAIYGIDANSFSRVAFGLEDLTSGDSSTVLQKLGSTPNGTLLSQRMAENLQLEPGESFLLNQTSPRTAQSSSLRIVGTYKFLPGIDSPLDNLEQQLSIPQPLLGSVLVSIATMHSMNLTNIVGHTFLVRTRTGSDIGNIVNTIRSLANGELINIETLQAAIQTSNSSPQAASPLAFLQLSTAYLFVAAVTGSALTSWSNVRARSREITILRARGASVRQVLKLLSADIFAILALSILLAIPTGLMEAYAVIRFLASPASASAYSDLVFRILLPPEMSAILLLGSLSLLISSILPSWLVMRRALTEAGSLR